MGDRQADSSETYKLILVSSHSLFVLSVSTKISLKGEQRIAADPNSAAPAVTTFSARKTIFPARNVRERFVLGIDGRKIVFSVIEEKFDV
jgi:hypothetical protein